MWLSAKYGRFLYALSLVFAAQFAVGQESVLNSGMWYKISVDQHGVYRIDQAMLKKAGVNTSQINPRHIQLYGMEGGMLPQSNAVAETSLRQLSIHVRGEEDGVFNNDDYVLFFAQGPDNVRFDPSNGTHFYEKNLFADRNYYFLRIGDDPGLRMTEVESVSGSFPTVTTFDDYVYHENDLHNELRSGREWYGERFDLTTDRTLTWDVPGIIAGSLVKVVSEVMAQANASSSFSLRLNDVSIGEQSVLPIPTYTYGVKGQTRRDTFDVTIDAVANAQLRLNYQYVKGGSGRSVGFLDHVLITYKRKLSLYGDQTIFTSSSAFPQPVSTFEVSSPGTDAMILDVTDPFDPKIQQHQQNGQTKTFSVNTTTLKNFVIFNRKASAPQWVGDVPNQNLIGLATPDFLIITHPLFLGEAERLASHRRQHNGLQVVVATTEQVYNEFSGGRQDIAAIRNFVRHLNERTPGVLKNVLLFGRGSYDYKARVTNNTNFVATYESRNSLSPLETYSSDDFFVMLEDHEGIWSEGESPDYHTLDLGVGRLPVKTVDEAISVVNKIIEYDTKSLGNWRKQIVFVADDGDIISPNLHQRQADQLAQYVSENGPQFDPRKIYLDAFDQVLMPAGETSPDATKKIIDAIDKGALIVNYTGHGTEKIWAAERVFDDFMIARLENTKYALFVTATCEFGRQDDPQQISSAELAVLRKNSGAIGMVSTARPVNASTNFELNKAFYETLLSHTGQPLTLGELFMETKNKSISGVSNRNFSLIGDPSLVLAVPQLKTNITSIVTEESADTLKALSKVTVQGEVITDAGERATFFSGVLQVELFDKPSELTTKGDENPPFAYTQWDNALFRGKATVSDGAFQFSFVVPKNISYPLGNGKMSLYAYDKDKGMDAGGAEEDFVVGLSAENAASDNTPPLVEAYIGDTTFINGGITVPDTRLIVALHDSSGINLSSYGIGNSLIAVLDDNESFILNDYYEADLDDFSRGWINFPLQGLAPGRHVISVKAWDTHNNAGSATVEFVVSDGNAIAIETFTNYPNPFRLSTTLFFTHNRSGDDIEASLAIYDITGKLLKTLETTIYSSPYEVELLEMDIQQDIEGNLQAGLYLARLVVRSLSNGSKNERVTKLIVTN